MKPLNFGRVAGTYAIASLLLLATLALLAPHHHPAPASQARAGWRG